MGNEQGTQTGRSGTSRSGKGGDDEYGFVKRNHRVSSIWELFKEGKSLGEGASCKVVVAEHREKGSKVAMKLMKQNDQWNPTLFKQEVHVLRALKRHPNVLQYVDSYMDKTFFCFCTKMLGGGELFDRIKERQQFNEEQAQYAMKQIISALRFCHELTQLEEKACDGLVHRDLKPENIVYKEKNGEDLCIIDFGDAKAVENNEVYDDFVGTAFYLAPEVVRNRKGWELKASDMWTVGVICYVLCTGRPPFWGRDNREILTKILKSKLTFPKKAKLTSGTKAFIKALIQKKPEDRLTARDALSHPWLQGVVTNDDLPEDREIAVAARAQQEPEEEPPAYRDAERYESNAREERPRGRAARAGEERERPRRSKKSSRAVHSKPSRHGHRDRTARPAGSRSSRRQQAHADVEDLD